MLLPARLQSVLPYRRGVPAHISSLLLLLQRSPLVKLLPEARVISTSGFTETLKFTVAAVAGLGAFDAVSGATVVSQTSPSQGQPVVNLTGGSSSTFAYQATSTAGRMTPGSWSYSGHIPAGLVPADLEGSLSCFMNGTPVEVGSFPVSITLHEDGGDNQSVTGDFTIVVAAPAAPAISVQPQGGNFLPGAVVNLQATQTAGFFFKWSKDGDALPTDSTALISRTSPRRFFPAPSNPGDTWRTGVPFNDATWTAVSGGIGYDRSVSPVDYHPHIAAGGNVQTQMFGAGRPTSCLIRIPFSLTGSTPISNLKLLVQCDDGFIAWLNGTEVASQNRFADVPFNSAAGAPAVDSEALIFREIDISRSIAVLRTGPGQENLLAIQAMRSADDEVPDSDFLFNCELIGGTNDGTHTRRLIIPSITPQQAGEYRLNISNPTGAVTSDPAVLVLPPQIENHPASIEIESGATTTLAVEAVISPPWTYQWYRGNSGDATNPVAGATDIFFTTPPLTQPENYWVRVTNPAGSVDSSTATVTLHPPFVIWQRAVFTAEELADPLVSGPAADPDRDGMNNEHEYVFGTRPKTPEPSPMPVITDNAGTPTVAFTATAATGPGYATGTRLYTVETAASLTNGPWVPLPGFENIPAAGQTVTAPLPAGPPHAFVRLRVSLTP